MPRDNQILIDEGLDRFLCLSCDERSFNSEPALLQHCRCAASHKGEWCERCTWLFVSRSACQAHERDSPAHWICSECGLDEAEEKELNSHMAKVHSYCLECECKYNDYKSHRISHHNRCGDCGQEFENENNLRMHKQRHSPRSKECYGCTAKYSTVSAMMLHLESDTCPSGVTLGNIDEWAFGCYQSGYYTNDWDDEYRYRCPTCETNFEFVSGLLQHIESPSCDAKYKGSVEKLRKYLFNQCARQIKR